MSYPEFWACLGCSSTVGHHRQDGIGNVCCPGCGYALLRPIGEQSPSPGTRWRHYKGGLYTIVGLALRADNLALQVVYRSESDGMLWIRDRDEFLAEVLVDGVEKPRFAKELA